MVGYFFENMSHCFVTECYAAGLWKSLTCKESPSLDAVWRSILLKEFQTYGKTWWGILVKIVLCRSKGFTQWYLNKLCLERKSLNGLYSFENANSTDLFNKKALFVYAVFIENSNLFRKSCSMALLFVQCSIAKRDTFFKYGGAFLQESATCFGIECPNRCSITSRKP